MAAVLDSESHTPRIEIYTEPILTEKDFIHFERLASHGEEERWVEGSETSTATARR